MRNRMPRYLSVVIAALMLVLTGCEDDDPYSPPAGMGALLVDNRTAADLQLFVNGEAYPTVENGDDSVWDLDPFLYRIVLNDENDQRNYSADLDILADRVTELRVYSSLTDFNGFDVEVRYLD